MANKKRRGLQSSPFDSYVGVTYDVREIPVKKITIPEDEERWRSDLKNIDKLAGSIRLQGLLQPIGLRKIGRTDYELIYGKRRTLAYKYNEEHHPEAGDWERIPAKIWPEDADPLLVEMAEITENFDRQDLTPRERRQHSAEYTRILQEYQLRQTEGRPRKGDDKLTMDDVAEQLNRSKRSLQDDLRIENHVPAEVQDALEKTGYGDSTRILLELSRMESKGEQMEAVHRLASNEDLTVKDAEKFLKREHRAKRGVSVDAKARESKGRTSTSSSETKPERKPDYRLLQGDWRAHIKQLSKASIDVCYTTKVVADNTLDDVDQLVSLIETKLSPKGLLALYVIPERLDELLKRVREKSDLRWHTLVTVLVDGSAKPLCVWRRGSAAVMPRSRIDVRGPGKEWVVTAGEARDVLSTLGSANSHVFDPWASPTAILEAADELDMTATGVK